jgi:diadenosine tetraphosphate (Ap4A) HIT family hydrolase
MLVRAMTEAERAERAEMIRGADELKAAGVCPTCRNLVVGGVYPPVAGRLYYEDDLVCCFLEQYPRGPGHTIILVRPHYEDIAEMPPEVGVRVYPVIHAAIAALKKVIGAEKIYFCTMCDGPRNHLHFQLIPRLPGDPVQGSRVFVKERGILTQHAKTVQRLSLEMADPKPFS